MTMEPIVAIGLAVAAVGLGLGLLAAILAVRGARTAPARGRRMDRRTFIGLAGVAGLLAVGVVAQRVRLLVTAPSASPSLEPRTPTVLPVRRSAEGAWISPDELAALPVDVPAFDRLRRASAEGIPRVDVSNQDSPGPTATMATALVAARLDDEGLRGDVRDALLQLLGTEHGDTGGHPERNRLLAIGRNMPGYVIAASIIGLARFDPAADGRFRSWIDELRTVVPDGSDASLAEAEPLDHSNWGAYGSAAMTAINRYLDDRSALTSSADMLLGWLGDRSGRQDWRFDTERHDYSWQCAYPDVSRYLPVNPLGCERDGLVIDGVITVDMQRGDGFRVPPVHTRYPREGLHGRTIQAEILYRAGYDTYAWADAGLKRIAERLLALAESFDPAWYEPDIACYRIIAARTGATLPLEEPTIGRSITGIDWTVATGGGE